MSEISKGDIIGYSPTGGGEVVVRVLSTEIHNGRPSFDGVVLDPATFETFEPENDAKLMWGYDHQVTRIIRAGVMA